MTKLYITEMSREGHDATGGDVNAMSVAGITEQNIVVSGATQQSAAFQPTTAIIRLHAQVACSVAFGTNPSATVATLRIPLGGTEYFSVPTGVAWKVAVIANA